MSDYQIPQYKLDQKLYTPQFTKKNVMLKRREWLDRELRLNGKCEKCGRLNLLTIDHIIPVFFLKDLGLDLDEIYDEENLRLLCKPCNALKSNHFDFSTPKTKYLLRKFIKDI